FLFPPRECNICRRGGWPMDTWYIAEGGLHCMGADGATRSVQSPFVQEALQRNERARQLEGWKTAQPDDDGGGRMVSRATLWGSGRSGWGTLTHRFRYVTRGAEDSIYYVIFVGNGTALFRYYPAQAPGM